MAENRRSGKLKLVSSHSALYLYIPSDGPVQTHSLLLATNRSLCVLASMSPTLPHSFLRGDPDTLPAPVPSIPFAGRIGANQQFSLDKNNCSDKALLKKYPDAAPLVPLRDTLSLRQFLEVGLWKAAAVEGIGTPAVAAQNATTKCTFDIMLTLPGTCLLVYLTILFPVGLAENTK